MEETETMEIPTTTKVAVFGVIIASFFGLYLMISYLPFIVFILFHTACALTYALVLWRSGDKKWTVIVLVYATIFLFFTLLIIPNRGLRLLVTYGEIKSYMETAALIAAVASFMMGLPMYILSFIIITIAFVFTFIIRKSPMWVAMKWISLILIIIGILAAFITYVMSGTTGAEIIAGNFYFFTIVGSFLSGYQFIMSFLSGLLEGRLNLQS
jgi:hypothetical protein